MTVLSELLRRVAAFLDELPADVLPNDLAHHWDVDGEISLRWIDTWSPVRECSVWFWPQEKSTVQFYWRTGLDWNEPITYQWVDAPVPPELVEKIRTFGT